MINTIKKYKYVFALLALAIGIFTYAASISFIRDYDYFFHYYTGEYIIENHIIPTMAIGSWYGLANDLIWISHEWLFGVLAYVITNVASEQVFCVLSYILLIGVLLYVVYTQRNRFKRSNIILALLMIGMSAKMMVLGMSPRPHIFGYWFTVFLYVILNRDNEKEGNAIFLLLPLTLLWVNFHGGSYLLLFVMAIMSFVLKTFSYDKETQKIHFHWTKQNKKRWLVLLLCFLLVIINGHGINMYLYPLTNMGDEVMQTSIKEWYAPDLKVSKYLPYYLVMAMTAACFVFTKKKIRLFDLFFWLGFMYLGFRSVRFIPQVCLVSCLVAFRYSDEFLRFNLKDRVLRPLLLFITGCVLVVGLARLGTSLMVPSVFTIYRGFFPSDEIIEKIKEENPQRLFNDYGYGGYLLYQHIDTFIDGRADIYSKYNLEDYVDMLQFQDGALDLLEEYNFDYFILSDCPLNEYFKGVPEKYKLIASDEESFFYKAVVEKIEK